MNILFLSNAPWLDTNSVGNTLSNWFSEWDNTKICSVYTRDSKPDNLCCHYYYQVTAVDVVKYCFS